VDDVVEWDRRIATIAEKSRNLKKHIVMHNYCLRFFVSFALTSEELVRAVGQVVSTYSRSTTTS
jgi:hypothetical protein